MVGSSADVTVVEGSTVVLVCTAEGNPTPHVAWIAPNGTVLQNRTTDTNLMLKSVSRHCRGSYQCVAANERGSATVKVNLVVWCKYESCSFSGKDDSENKLFVIGSSALNPRQIVDNVSNFAYCGSNPYSSKQIGNDAVIAD